MEAGTFACRGGSRMCKKETRQAIGQCRLADAARSSQEPAMVHPPRCILAQQQVFRSLMPLEVAAAAGMVFAFARVFGFLAHASPASGATARHISCATAS